MNSFPYLNMHIQFASKLEFECMFQSVTVKSNLYIVVLFSKYHPDWNVLHKVLYFSILLHCVIRLKGLLFRLGTTSWFCDTVLVGTQCKKHCRKSSNLT
jgi:hypothetical protein